MELKEIKPGDELIYCQTGKHGWAEAKLIPAVVKKINDVRVTIQYQERNGATIITRVFPDNLSRPIKHKPAVAVPASLAPFAENWA